MKVAKIIKLAEVYNALIIKKANLLTNMAARILWSTIPAEQQINHTVALKSLVPGAKELLKYASLAIIDELTYIEKIPESALEQYNSYFPESAPITGMHKILSNKIKNNEYEEPLKLSYMLFEDESAWPIYTGGKNWANITKNVLNLHYSIANAEKNRDEGKWDQYINSLQEMTVYMNVLDGIVHNTGSLLEKMIYKEVEALRNYTPGNTSKYEIAIQKLMDAKELRDTSAVINIASDHLKNIPEKLLPFKDWISDARYQNYWDKDKQETNTEEELKLIRFKKEWEGTKANFMSLVWGPLERTVNEESEPIYKYDHLKRTFIEIERFGRVYIKPVMPDIAQKFDLISKIDLPSTARENEQIFYLYYNRIQEFINKLFAEIEQRFI